MACSHLMVGDREEVWFINSEISLHFQAEMGEVEPCHKRCINPGLLWLVRRGAGVLACVGLATEKL